MIVVAIIAILAAIAIPMYRDYLTRSKLTEAQNLLSDYRTKMEQYFQDNRSYVSSGTTCGAPLPSAASNFFTYTCLGSSTTYTATATGIAGKGADNFAFTIDQTNTRITTKVPPKWVSPTTNCWVVRKSGDCT
ncbi:type IV pilin protein [Xanthomonas sp. NCPPB 2632]|uniref:type IV pilin protein n=1 Tax=Xanthomonas sp. NCPPB 2632 TaxID=3240912 RepID=UPI0035160646